MDPNYLLDHFGQATLWLSLVIIFVECGLFFPFLPGDTLLFFVGLFIKRAEVGQSGIHMNLWVACALLIAAAWGGNVAGYEIGRKIGPRLYERDGRIIQRKHLDETRRFFDHYGTKAIVLGRFVPFVRTYVTLVAGITGMDRRKFFVWSLVGAVFWAAGIVLLGYFLGNVTFLQNNLELALLAVLIIPAIPMVWEYYRARRKIATNEG